MKSAYSFARARRLRQRSDPKTAGEHGALRQRSRRSGVKERGFPKGENSRSKKFSHYTFYKPYRHKRKPINTSPNGIDSGGTPPSPFGFPPFVCHIRKQNEKLYLRGNILKSDKKIETHPASINTSPISQPESRTDVNVNHLTHLRMELTAEALRPAPLGFHLLSATSDRKSVG